MRNTCPACHGFGVVGLWPAWRWLKRLFPRLDYVRECELCDGTNVPRYRNRKDDECGNAPKAN